MRPCPRCGFAIFGPKCRTCGLVNFRHFTIPIALFTALIVAFFAGVNLGQSEWWK